VVSTDYGRRPAMLGQTVFYTLSDADKQVRGALPRDTYPAIVVDDHGDNVLALVIFTSVWRDPTYVRPKVANGDPGQPGTWNAVAP
jgi:hypothetical protein